MKTLVDQAIAGLVSSGLVSESDLAGCSEAEIRAIEDAFSIRLPASYRRFLARLGKRAGDFLRGTDFRYGDQVDIFSQRKLADELLKKSCSSFHLMPTHFVFMSHQGCKFLFFDCDGSDDPAVWCYLEGDVHPQPIASRFSMWFAACVVDEVDPNSGDTMQ
jgi:hypothetical protein